MNAFPSTVFMAGVRHIIKMLTELTYIYEHISFNYVHG